MPSGEHHVIDAQAHEIATSKLAIDSQVEKREVANSPSDLKANPDRPDFSRLQRRLLASDLAFVPRLMGLLNVRCSFDHDVLLLEWKSSSSCASHLTIFRSAVASQKRTLTTEIPQ